MGVLYGRFFSFVQVNAGVCEQEKGGICRRERTCVAMAERVGGLRHGLYILLFLPLAG